MDRKTNPGKLSQAVSDIIASSVFLHSGLPEGWSFIYKCGALKFLGNENIPLSSINYLRSKGFDIIGIGMDHPGVTDEEVMQLAMHEERTILTYDSDYGELIFKYGYKPQAGVIFRRVQPHDALNAAKTIEKLISSGDIFTQRLTVVDNNSIRQRRY